MVVILVLLARHGKHAQRVSTFGATVEEIRSLHECVNEYRQLVGVDYWRYTPSLSGTVSIPKVSKHLKGQSARWDGLHPPTFSLESSLYLK